jgi:hypothetical protein
MPLGTLRPHTMRARRASHRLFASVVLLLCLACSPARSDLVAEQAAAVRAEAPVAAAGDHGAGAHRHHIRKHVRRPERPRLQGGPPWPATPLPAAPVGPRQTHQHAYPAVRAGNLSLPCAPGCEQRGNCNIEEGRCECPYGWAGPACEQAMFPACKVLDGSEEVRARQSWKKLCAMGSGKARRGCCFAAAKAAARLWPGGRCASAWRRRPCCLRSSSARSGRS